MRKFLEQKLLIWNGVHSIARTWETSNEQKWWGQLCQQFLLPLNILILSSICSPFTLSKSPLSRFSLSQERLQLLQDDCFRWNPFQFHHQSGTMWMKKSTPHTCLARCLTRILSKWLFWLVAVLIAAWLFGYFMLLDIPVLLSISRFGFKYVILLLLPQIN